MFAEKYHRMSQNRQKFHFFVKVLKYFVDQNGASIPRRLNRYPVDVFEKTSAICEKVEQNERKKLEKSKSSKL